MPAIDYKARRERCYHMLKKTVAERGRVPFTKKNQKYAKILIFMFESLTEMARNKKLQNNECVVFKVQFVTTCFNSHKNQHVDKVVFDYAITGKSARLKCFELQHCSKEELIFLLEDFSAYYGLTLGKRNSKYIDPEEENKYTIRIPF